MKETRMHTLSYACPALCAPGLLSWLTGYGGLAGKRFHTDPTSARSQSHAYALSHTHAHACKNSHTLSPKVDPIVWWTELHSVMKRMRDGRGSKEEERMK